MVIPIVLLALAALALGAAAASSTPPPTVDEACRLPAAAVPLEGRVLVAWVRCAGRTATEVRALTDRLLASGDAAGAQAIAELWQQLRATTSSVPSTSTDAAARAALAASDAEARRPEFVSTAPLEEARVPSRPASSAVDHPAMEHPAMIDQPAGGETVLPALRSAAARAVTAVRGMNATARRRAIPAVRAFQQLIPGLSSDGLYGSNTRVALAFYTGVPSSSLPEPAFPGPITWAPDGDASPIAAELRPDQAATSDRPTLPRGADADAARRLAGPLSRRLRGARAGSYRDEIRAFQRAAGLTADGLYGGTTANALRYFGIADAAIPAPHQPPQRDDARAAYPPRS
jgi:hypothetical protein